MGSGESLYLVGGQLCWWIGNTCHSAAFLLVVTGKLQSKACFGGMMHYCCAAVVQMHAIINLLKPILCLKRWSSLGYFP